MRCVIVNCLTIKKPWLETLVPIVNPVMSVGHVEPEFVKNANDGSSSSSNDQDPVVKFKWDEQTFHPP